MASAFVTNAPRPHRKSPRSKNWASQPYDSPWNRSSHVIGAWSDARMNSKTFSPGRGLRPGGGGAFQSIDFGSMTAGFYAGPIRTDDQRDFGLICGVPF